MAIVWRGDSVTETVPGGLGDIVILPTQRQPVISETVGRAVAVAL